MKNWNNILWNTLKVLLVIILNTPLWVYLIGSFVPYETIGEFRLSWIDYLRLSDRVEWYHIWILYIFIPVGILLSVMFIKWLIVAGKREKDKQEMLAANEANTNKIIEALQIKQKEELDKQIARAKKYLGD